MGYTAVTGAARVRGRGDPRGHEAARSGESGPVPAAVLKEERGHPQAVAGSWRGTRGGGPSDLRR